MDNTEFTVSQTCLLCRRKFEWNEVIIIKAPEGACFCIPCADKWEDDTVGDGYVAWISHQFGGVEKFVYLPCVEKSLT